MLDILMLYIARPGQDDMGGEVPHLCSSSIDRLAAAVSGGGIQFRSIALDAVLRIRGAHRPDIDHLARIHSQVRPFQALAP